MKDTDILVFGATGFTGQLVCEYLAAHAPKSVRWRVAGRRADALLDVAKRHESSNCPPAGVAIGASDDPAALKVLAERSRVVITTVGPYAKHGGPLAHACAEAGTDYLDITGEPTFVARTIVEEDAIAKKTGARLVSCCGFDSIPHDLGAYFTMKTLRDRGIKGSPVTMRGAVRSKGTFSGGTWHSAIHAMASFKKDRHESARARKTLPPLSPGRVVRPLARGLHYDRALHAWLCPLPTIDPEVVLRSARELEDLYGKDFRYGHYARVKSIGTVAVGGAAVGALFGLAQIGKTRDLLLKVRSPGEGPSPETRAKSWFEVTFVAEAGGQKVVTKVSGKDPGYTETAKMISEAALCFALDDDQLPDRCGVLTPALAFEEVLIDRLEAAGIRFETET